ncbi:fatty acid cis/trans isomerase [Litoribacillus peritrichatus]|uniref:Fatty acid cis/trans isomerase n=1 Tax=Litoribacillus peritrichatus TaxID=718191 RepID=A0ABP7MQG5_9GAMM
MRSFKLSLHWPWLLFLLAGCAGVGITQYDPLSELYGQAAPKNRMVEPESSAGQHYLSEVEPIIEQRCVVCHGCYDAPCQLKLSSPEGIDRGASKDVVYDGTRILASDPTRLGIDAENTFEWRRMGFHPILNERTQTPAVNLQASLMYQFISQKQQQPATTAERLSNDIPLGLNHPAQCPSPVESQDYLTENPKHGMPYGLPALANEEYTVLTQWLANGANMANQPKLTSPYLDKVAEWETFLNQDDLKHQLMARYVYEHIYLAHLYFTELDSNNNSKQRTYFKLVRSATPPGSPINRIKTRRPYDDPGVQRVYYRLQREDESILAKTHMPYTLDAERMNWIKSLFIEPNYTVASLPGYEPKVAANPFEAFKDIPSQSRYRFMLEESQFTIMGFIKGPVCRGQIALNVIDDHFWVLFIDPDINPENLDKLINTQRENLILPGEKQSNAGVIKNWVAFSAAQNKYLKNKLQLIKYLSEQEKLNLDLIWDGDRTNDNATLTIFRHFDSSTVLKGLVGQEPKTAWLIDYPLLERIHYLLVAEYDVFGNVGHQVNTRLYMDFLRMEGEGNFLSLLPAEERKKLWRHWYRNSQQEVKEFVFGPRVNFDVKTNIEFTTESPKTELLNMVQAKLGTLQTSPHNLTDSALDRRLAKLKQLPIGAPTLMPEMGILSIENEGKLALYTILRNSGHSNIDSLLFEDSNRLPEEDYLTINKGITGSYPAAYWHVSADKLDQFIHAVSTLQTESDYDQLMDEFGIRRTNPDFWAHSDRIHQQYLEDQPDTAGLLDYNRLENR